VPGVSDADVRITWDPPWNQQMISEEGKMKLGLIWNPPAISTRPHRTTTRQPPVGLGESR